MFSEKGLQDAVNSIAVNVGIDVRGWSISQIVDLLLYIRANAPSSGPREWFDSNVKPGTEKVIVRK